MDVTAILSADPAESAQTPGRDASTSQTKPVPGPSAPRRLPDESAADTPTADGGAGEETNYMPAASLRRNANGGVSLVYSGTKIRHLKKEDGQPLWRKDIQYDFLRTVFHDETRVFTKYSDRRPNHTFAEVYIDAMARSSKCSKILKEKLLQDKESAMCMAMVCLLVNVGRMNTTLNFFPEMRAQLRTYHSIPALQAHQDPNAYKQLQDAPRLKSILKGATEDEPQPATLEHIQATAKPRTNAVNLIFVLSQYAPRVSDKHFPPQRDFFDLVMRDSLSSQSRAKAFLWLLWWYLESDFSHEASRNNPFGPGELGEGEDSSAVPLKVPAFENLTEEQAAKENEDTEEEIIFGEVKRKERVAILASDPSPAMTALKRARGKERSSLLPHDYPGTTYSDDEMSEAGGPRIKPAPARGRSLFSHEFPSDDNTRSPSLPGDRRPGGLAAKPDMRINTLLNSEDAMSEASPPRASASGSGMKKGPGRGNWRRNKPKEDVRSVPQDSRPRAHGITGQVTLLPNIANPLADYPSGGPLSRSPLNGVASSSNPRDHVPTPSYQAQKRGRGVTQHQSALITHRKQQIDYTLDRRIRRVQARAQIKREAEGSIVRAWKRIRLMPSGYDSEEEGIKLRRGKDRGERDDDVRAARPGKENFDIDTDADAWRRQVALMAGITRVDGEATDVGEEIKSLVKAFDRLERRLNRWAETSAPADPVIRRRELQAQDLYQPHRKKATYQDLLDAEDEEDEEDDDDVLHIMAGAETAAAPAVTSTRKQRSDAGKARVRKSLPPEPQKPEIPDLKVDVDSYYDDYWDDDDDDDDFGELDEDDRRLLEGLDADADMDSEEESDFDDEEMMRVLSRPLIK